MTERILRLISAGVGICLMSGGCFSGNGDTKKEGPEAGVEDFFRALTAGDWEQACCLCDTAVMDGYLKEYRLSWEKLNQEDSSALRIASSVLANATVEIRKVEKAQDGRAVLFTIEAEGMQKDRRAMVKKNEEGAWQIAEITDEV